MQAVDGTDKLKRRTELDALSEADLACMAQEKLQNTFPPLANHDRIDDAPRNPVFRPLAS